MEKVFEVSCPKCKALFKVPVELGGEVAECAECDFVFEIPHPAPDESRELDVAEKIKGYELGTTTSNNTVKLSRTSIGMIPIIKDRFLYEPKPLPPKN